MSEQTDFYAAFATSTQVPLPKAPAPIPAPLQTPVSKAAPTSTPTTTKATTATA